MKLVVDSNILFSFFRDNPTRSLIINAKLYGLQLYSPDYAINELENNIKDLIKYTKLSEENLYLIFKTLRQYIKMEKSDGLKHYKEKAGDISPHNKDVLFFAIALKLKSSIWSNEPRLKKQKKVKVLTTEEVRKLVGFE